MRQGTKIGVFLAGGYALYAIGLFSAAHFAEDLKGRVILEQLAAAPAMLALSTTRLLGPLMEAFPSMNNYYAVFGMSVAMMYFLGWGMAALDSI